jgi:hypothetical protein
MAFQTMQQFRRLYKRLVTGDGLRRSRFHTYSGHLIDWAGLRYLPRAAWSAALLKCFGYRQRQPWLGYRAVKRLGELARPDWTVLEFGSGMSSLFFASRCRHLVSIESDPTWYEQMKRLFARERITNVDYRLRGPADYTRIDDYPDQCFDLVIIDGLVRDQAARAAARKVKPDGYLFLDNSDVRDPEFQTARATLLELANGDQNVSVFTDLTPFDICVSESLLVCARA